MKEPVYLAGPYRNSDLNQKMKNVKHANEVAQWFAEMGVTFVSPISHTAFFDDACPNVKEGFWLELGMILLRNCQSIYMMKGWVNSLGAKQELDMAKAWGLDIYYEEHDGLGAKL